MDSNKQDHLRNISFHGNLPPIGNNASQSKLNQSASIYLETGTQDKDRHLFSLSSTQPENLGAILSNKENFAPKHLDFNQYNGLNDKE